MLFKWHAAHWFQHCVQCPHIAFCLQTIAEKKAWELSKQEGFELTTVMPSLVLGPVTGTRPDGTSINAFKVSSWTPRYVQACSICCSADIVGTHLIHQSPRWSGHDSSRVHDAVMFCGLDQSCFSSVPKTVWCCGRCGL